MNTAALARVKSVVLCCPSSLAGPMLRYVRWQALSDRARLCFRVFQISVNRRSSGTVLENFERLLRRRTMNLAEHQPLGVARSFDAPSTMVPAPGSRGRVRRRKSRINLLQ